MRVEIDVPDDNPPLAALIVRHVLEGLAMGARPLFWGPNALPPLYESGIYFKPEAAHGSGVEPFRMPSYSLSRGYADCDGLVVYRLSELYAQGIPAGASVADFPGNGNMHAQIRLPDGSIEDPAIILGAENQWPSDFTFDL